MATTTEVSVPHNLSIEPRPSPIPTARETTDHRDPRGMLFGAAASLALLGLAFWSNLRHFVWTWSTDENYSHGFLVPLLSLYFAHEAARRGPLRLRNGVGLGSGLIVLAILGRLATILVPVGIVGDVAFVLGLAGICALILGRDALRRYSFALFFLVFMIPLPIALYTAIASPLQQNVSRIASVLLNGIGIPVLRQGNMMTLPGDVHMFVAEACSGMRQLTGFLALTTAVAYLSARPWWYRVVLVGSAIPIAMTANVIRVMLTGMIMYHINPKFASGSFHTIEGLLMMGVGLAILTGECLFLNQLVGTPQESATGETSPSETSRPIPRKSLMLGAMGRAVLGLTLLGTGLVAQAVVERATVTERPPLRASLANLPLRLGNWVGRDVPIDAEVLRESQADDYLNRVYEDPSHPGRRLTLWINYSRHGLNLRHSPEICLPSGGWTRVESRCRTLPIERPEGSPMPITQLGYSQGELFQSVGFWYYIFGEGSVEQFVRSLPVTSRSSHGRTTRGSGLTVEVFCPGEADPDGEALREFATSLLTALEPILPEDRATYFIP